MAIQKIDINNLDKSNWQTYRFDEIAQSISERVDPNSTDLEVYIGLEHIDSEAIHIKRMGTREDVNGQKLRFYPGDVIFGRRRAYQRKAAIATTDGFCSAHSLVLRANSDVIDPRLFPFFIHSDMFMHRAIDISVGSLSPTINWGTLKHQEFILPPKEQQAELAELLWAMDEVIEKDLKLMEKTEITRQSSEKKFFKSKELEPIVEASSIFDKITDGTHDTPAKKNNGYKLLTSKNITENKLSLKTDYYISEEDYAAVNNRSKVDINDILFGMIGTVGQVCRIIESPDYAIKNMGLFKTTDVTISSVGFYYFKSNFFQNNLKRTLSGTTQKYVSLSYLRSLKLPDPNNSVVLDWIDQELKYEKITGSLEFGLASSKNLQKSLISQVF